MGIYTIIEDINNVTIFMYIIILLLSFTFFKNKNIGLNIILALIVGLVFITYNYDKIETTKNIEEKQQQVKAESIKPTPLYFNDKDNVIDLLFSVQDLYKYNPQAYEEVIDNLDSFFEIYGAIKRGSKFCDSYFQIADSKKNNAINAFHSIILTIPANFEMVDKYNRAHKRLETIMNVYLNELYDNCEHDLLKNGYNVYRRMINTGPKEYNHYFDKDYTYQLY